MKIAIASDHGGFYLKEKLYQYLKVSGYDVEDFGVNSPEPCDYPAYAKLVCDAILKKGYNRGILICGTGVGMAICANRFKGIRAVNANETYSAKMSREHNDSNVLTLGARVLGEGLAIDIIDIWLRSEFQGGRHEKRIKMLEI